MESGFYWIKLYENSNWETAFFSKDGLWLILGYDAMGRKFLPVTIGAKLVAPE